MVKKLGYSTSVFEGANALLGSQHVGMDLIMCLIGPRISSGTFRDVYEHTHDPSNVIKIEYGFQEKGVHDSIMQNSFCNIQEFLLWREIEGLKGPHAWVKDWFAPIDWISPSGHILCMRKTEQKPGKGRPDKIPEFLWDVKQCNFGWIGNKFVCHDYAHISSMISYGKRIKSVKHIWD